MNDERKQIFQFLAYRVLNKPFTISTSHTNYRLVGFLPVDEKYVPKERIELKTVGALYLSRFA